MASDVKVIPGDGGLDVYADGGFEHIPERWHAALLRALIAQAGGVEVEVRDGVVRDWPLVNDGPALVIPMEDE